MKKFLLTLMIAVGSLSMVMADAEARRMGGGGSFGRQSHNVSRQATPPTAAPMQRQAQPGAAPQQRSGMWKGLLGGALLGLGLGALLSHFGIGGALASMIATLLTFALLAAAAVFIFRLLARKNGAPMARSGMQPAYASPTPEIGSGIAPQPAAFQGDGAQSGSAADAGTWTMPADFDAAAFARTAKTQFIRLQAAWDAGNVNDIREFTTPEMFAELRMQLQERGTAANQTDVVQIEAEVLGVETIGGEYLASVRFNGMIREEAHGSPQPFAEVWNLTKPVSGNGGWLLAGIQQVQ